eukprot:CAMPEP_0178740508 /NCGR_PEP_ID=MMETSP0744-20121128/4629_1 /TAXON_ID=913974 /ORGANISM="Nitzschia punctata, Strain CCMP561" /LENGTH=354 /DNA_ID=CAMNT_0020393289 /DNA_START=95 /DNA_END=1159 /DNA_ORIENTATION=+
MKFLAMPTSSFGFFILGIPSLVVLLGEHVQVTAFIRTSPRRGHRWNTISSSLSIERRTVPPSTSQRLPPLSMETVSMEIIDDFFRTQPFLAAFLTCSLKASAADLAAQTSAKTTDVEHEKTNPTSAGTTAVAKASEVSNSLTPDVNMNRTFSFFLYGGLYQGMFLQFLYTVAYPYLYGNSSHQVVLQIHSEIVLFGPFLTLPLAYVIRALIDANDGTESPVSVSYQEGSKNGREMITVANQAHSGLEKYKNHVMTQGLLLKYWMVWGPAQTFNFLVVPPHLRVVFVAMVSFFWVYLLSMISSQGVIITDEHPTSTQSSQSSEISLLEQIQERIPFQWLDGLGPIDLLEKAIRSV